jgi:hypothetical protein
MLGQEGGAPHHTPRAKRVIQIFLSGAASQCDSFDYKPKLIEKAGLPWTRAKRSELFQSNPGAVMPSPWAWKRYGQSGKWVSDLFPEIAQCVHHIASVRHSLRSKSNIHGPATFMQNTGFILPGVSPAPAPGPSDALGTLNDNLPKFIVLPDHRGVPPNGRATGRPPSARGAPGDHGPRRHAAAHLRSWRRPSRAGDISPESEREGLALLDRVTLGSTWPRTPATRC